MNATRIGARRAIALVATSGLFIASGCRTAVEHTLQNDANTAPVFPEKVLLTMHEGDTVTVHKARVVHDSIVGYRALSRNTTLTPFAVPIASVQRYSYRKTDTASTLVAIGLIVGGFLYLGSRPWGG